MNGKTLRALVFTGTTALFLGIASGRATAQAMPTADQRAEISIFAGFSYVHPDYNHTLIDSSFVGHNYGMDFGGEYDLRPMRGFSPGLEILVQHSSGIAREAETQFAGGPKVQLHLGRIQPYVGFLFGFGNLLYPFPTYSNGTEYFGDNVSVMDAQLGLDYRLSTHFAVRAELMGQHWSRGAGDFHPIPGAIDFYPVSGTIGLKYRFAGRRVR